MLAYSGNVIQNLRVGLKIAHNSSFYTPDSANEDFVVDLTNTITNVLKAVSFKYKKEDGSTASADKWVSDDADYVPENVAVYPTPPPIVNPQGYAVVS